MRLRKRATRMAEQEHRLIDYMYTTRKLGIALLSFFLIYTASTLIRTPLYALLLLRLGTTVGLMAGQLIDMLFYALSFMLPVAVFRWITPRDCRVPMPLSCRISPLMGLLIPAGVAVVFCAAWVNSALLELFGLTVSSYPLPDPSILPTQTVLSFMAMAIVPAFCEEFLFRGLVLTQLLPFGKTTAVIGSALLFGLMHGNPAQMLYATVAGLVLGVVAVESGSVWAGVLIHLFNNMLSVLNETFWNRLQYPSGFYLQTIIEMSVVALGLICLVILLSRRDRTKQELGRTPLPVGAPLSGGTVRGFFTLPMTAFCLISGVEMILIVVAA